MINTKTICYNVNVCMTGMAALWNTYVVDALTAWVRSTVEYSVRRMTAVRAFKWQVVFVVCACVGVWCAHLLW